MVQPSFYEATRILFVCKENKTFESSRAHHDACVWCCWCRNQHSNVVTRSLTPSPISISTKMTHWLCNYDHCKLTAELKCYLNRVQVKIALMFSIGVCIFWTNSELQGCCDMVHGVSKSINLHQLILWIIVYQQNFWWKTTIPTVLQRNFHQPENCTRSAI